MIHVTVHCREASGVAFNAFRESNGRVRLEITSGKNYARDPSFTIEFEDAAQAEDAMTAIGGAIAGISKLGSQRPEGGE